MLDYYVEKQFTYKGYQCVVVMQSLGHRCGYVGIPIEHPLYGKDYFDYIDININHGNVPIDNYFSCHGGITYANGGVYSEYPIKGNLWWFGFDCAHWGDIRDFQAAKEIFRDNKDVLTRLSRSELLEKSFSSGGQVRSLKYVTDECIRLADQLSEYELSLEKDECVPKEECSFNDLFACGAEALRQSKLSGGDYL